MQSWNHDTCLADMLRVNENVERFQKCLADNPRFLQDKVEEHFLKNDHKLTLTMTPKDDYKEELEQEEERILGSMVAELNSEDKQVIYDKG